MFLKAIVVFIAVASCASAAHTVRVNQVQPLEEDFKPSGLGTIRAKISDWLRGFGKCVPSIPLVPSKDALPITPRDDTTKPVNERYPSAVLFGNTCGGTIIGDRWVLTSGHCTLFTRGREILAGTNNTADGTGVKARVKKLYLHPRFSVGPYWLNAESYDIKQVAARWDFLLAELKEPLVLDGKILAAAPLDDLTYHNPRETVGFGGFGTATFGGVMRSDMHAMDLELLSDQECGKLVEYDRQDMLCATGRPPRYDTACNGDSGSGLIGETGKLIGVASWVEGDAHECKNGAQIYFARVSAARHWIKSITGI